MKTQKTATKSVITEGKKKTFLDSPQWDEIVRNIDGILTSDGTMSTLLDFERCLDEADLYAFKNWELGELVDGPIVKRYLVTATFMWPTGLMPDPRGAKRLLPLGCSVKFKKTTIKVPVQIKTPDDYQGGTHYPKLIDRSVWLVNITIPKALMNDIREGSVDLADQTVDLEDLDTAYEKDYDTADTKDQGADQQGGGMGDLGMGGGMGDLGMGGAPGGGPGGPPGMGL
jgi:hypothetical protein